MTGVALGGPSAARPLQLGLLLDFPPLLGPATLSVGVLLLTVWFVADRLLPVLGVDTGLPSETVLVATLVVGLFTTALGAAVSTDALWAVALLLFLVGRGVEGAVFVRLLRKLAHYAAKAVAWLRGLADVRGSSTDGAAAGGAAGAVRSFVDRFVTKLLYRLLALGFLLVAVGVTVVLAATVVDFGRYTVPQVYALAVGTSALFAFAWNIRPALDRLGPLPFAGVLCCVVGAEVYNFPQAGVAPAAVQNALNAADRLVSLSFVGFGDVPTELAVVVAGVGAYALGAGFAGLVIVVDD